MSTALAPMSTHAIPTPPGADEPFRAPEPQPCEWCGGDGWEPQEEGIRCLECNGAGVLPTEFKMLRTRAYEVRSASYTPACEASGHPNQVVLTTAAKESHRAAKAHYDVYEIDTDIEGRAFVLGKVGSKEVYHVEIGKKWATCTCPGETYLATAKGNQAAHDAGEEVFPSHGCKHSDAIVALLSAGFFDLHG